eukprot:TRINITY_DN24444_c0_g1_i1.p1 TRINITY_DN24444_c0_g1~~TRINITY_DN24444_c0_g1_i1.p1  ORF type:complete len:422 (+),score=119.32 TRINITY_DN24444_c0_g1_i1:35-1300(+)
MLGKKSRQVFIGGLAPDTKEEDLRKALADVGGISDVTLWKDPESGRTKGAGKIKFETEELAKQAVQALRASRGSFSYATVFTDANPGEIDVQYDRASQWLVSRQKLQTDLDEAARSLLQRVRYDLPAVKNQEQTCQKQVQETESRQREASRQESETTKKLQDMCDAHHISGADFMVELQSYVNTAIPRFQENASSKVLSCAEALEFYTSITKSLREKGVGQEDENPLPVLRHLLANGNALLKDAAHLSEELQQEWKKLQEHCQDAGNVRMLGNARTRFLVVDDLLELETFLSQTCWQLEDRSSDGQLSLDEVKALHSSVAAALEALRGRDVQPLLALHCSPTALQNCAAKLSAQKALCARNAERSAALKELKASFAAEAEQCSKSAQALAAQVREQRAWLEAEMSRVTKYKVSLVGEINAV